MKDRRLVEGIGAQTHEALDNIEKVLTAAGGSLADIYEVRVILKKREHFAIVDRIFGERIPEKGFVAHAYEGVLLHPDMELEIEVNAYIGPLEGVERVGRP